MKKSIIIAVTFVLLLVMLASLAITYTDYVNCQYEMSFLDENDNDFIAPILSPEYNCKTPTSNSANVKFDDPNFFSCDLGDEETVPPEVVKYKVSWFPVNDDPDLTGDDLLSCTPPASCALSPFDWSTVALRFTVNYDRTPEECMCRNDDYNLGSIKNCVKGENVNENQACWTGTTCCGDDSPTNSEDLVDGIDGSFACCTPANDCVWNYGCHLSGVNGNEVATCTDHIQCCNDGIDNDCDGLTDFDDDDCTSSGTCKPEWGCVQVGGESCSMYEGLTFFGTTGSLPDDTTCVQGRAKGANAIAKFDPDYVLPVSTLMMCKVASDCGAYDHLDLYLEQPANSEVSINNGNLKLCCDVPLSPQCRITCDTKTTCGSTDTGVLEFSANSNAKVAEYGGTNYLNKLCCDMHNCGDYSLQATQGTYCQDDEECLITLEQWGGGATVTDCNNVLNYTNKICLKMVD